jgi:hypothetical protein
MFICWGIIVVNDGLHVDLVNPQLLLCICRSKQTTNDNLLLDSNNLNDTCVPMHITMELFEMNETIKQSVVTQLLSLLEKFGLLH